MFLGVHAVNPVNQELIPVYAADYVLADYGTGAIMAVPLMINATWTSPARSACRSVRSSPPVARTRPRRASPPPVTGPT